MPRVSDFYLEHMKNILIKRTPREAFRLALILGVVFAAGCRKSAGPASSEQSPAQSASLPMPAPHDSSLPTKADAQAKNDAGLYHLIEKRYAADPQKKKAMLEDAVKLNATLDAEDQLAERNRRTMVDPAPADFKPEPVARKIRLKLILENSTIPRGGRPRVRLELTNVGRDSIDYQEYESSFFVKDGGLLDSTRTIHFFLTDRRGRRVELSPGQTPASFQSNRSTEAFDVPAGLSEAEKKKWLVETYAMSRASTHFQVKLLPGETLRSIGDDDSPRENFKTLFTNVDFDKPGTYKLRVALDDRPEPPSRKYIEVSLRSGSTLAELQESQKKEMTNALGPVSSDWVVFEVTP